ncbi:MAG: archease [Desulfuromonadales bacterium]
MNSNVEKLGISDKHSRTRTSDDPYVSQRGLEAGNAAVTIDNKFQLLEHTADMGIEARAGSSEKVFEEMARGLVAMIYGDSPAAARVDAKILVRSEDRIELLVNWLNEVAYWCEKDNLVPAVFHIESISDVALEAIVAGEPFDPERHVVERSVKSVTHHQACLEKTPDGWYARVYVDL